MGKQLAGQVLMLFRLFLPIPRPGVPALTSPTIAFWTTVPSDMTAEPNKVMKG